VFIMSAIADVSASGSGQPCVRVSVSLRSDGRKAREQVRRAHRRRHAGGPRAREEAGDEVGAIRAHLEERPVHQHLEHVLAPDVDDESEPGPERRDVGEVLLGTDADIDPAGRNGGLQRGHDDLRGVFVRHQLLRERAARL
jgi:hypothetical protein